MHTDFKILLCFHVFVKVLVMQCFRVVYHEISHKSQVFSWYMCCSTICSFGTIFSELVQNILNWYNNFNCTGLFLSTV